MFITGIINILHLKRKPFKNIFRLLSQISKSILHLVVSMCKWFVAPRRRAIPGPTVNLRGGYPLSV